LIKYGAHISHNKKAACKGIFGNSSAENIGTFVKFTKAYSTSEAKLLDGIHVIDTTI